jgi:DNA-binding NtrC family response regulator
MSLADDTKAALLGYSWPGNVRELKNAIERALILTKSSIVARGALPGEVQSSAVRIDARQRFLLPEDGVNLDELERDLLQQALVRANGNRSQAARLLGISRHALTYRMKQLPAGTVLTSADDDD